MNQVGNLETIVNMALTKLKEVYGEDYCLENSDKHVFSLTNGLLLIGCEDDNITVEVLSDAVIPLDASYEGVFVHS